MKSTYTFAIDTKVLENFFTNCEKKSVVKSAILQQLVIEYLENGLRDDPSTTRSKTTPRQSNKGIVK